MAVERPGLQHRRREINLNACNITRKTLNEELSCYNIVGKLILSLIYNSGVMNHSFSCRPIVFGYLDTIDFYYKSRILLVLHIVVILSVIS